LDLKIAQQADLPVLYEILIEINLLLLQASSPPKEAIVNVSAGAKRRGPVVRHHKVNRCLLAILHSRAFRLVPCSHHDPHAKTDVLGEIAMDVRVIVTDKVNVEVRGVRSGHSNPLFLKAKLRCLSISDLQHRLPFLHQLLYP
jgi:hypothetical protein